MKMLDIKNGDKVLHIYNYGKESSETVVVDIGGWRTELESGAKVERTDLIIHLDDPLLLELKEEHKRYETIQYIFYGSKKGISDDVKELIDKIREIVDEEDLKNTLKMLKSCGALKNKNQFFTDKIKKINNT